MKTTSISLALGSALSLTAWCSSATAIDPIPETHQAPLALKILNTYRGEHPATAPRKLHLVYFTPADRDPEPRYQERLDAIMEDIRAFYRDGMERAGFGPLTFDLARNAQGKLIFHLVKGKEPEDNYNKPDNEKICRECEPVLTAAGIAFQRETILIFCNLAKWDAKARVFSHHSPYYGLSSGASGQTNGLCFVLDSVIQNLDDVPKRQPVLNDDEYGDMSIGKFNSVFIGGIAHELGHALALPHCGERWDEKSRGTSLMGMGNHTYREERRGDGLGSFLAMASAMRLAARPLFSKSDQDLAVEPQLAKSELLLSTNISLRELAGRRTALRVEGTVKATPPVYGVIAYFDSLGDGGYHAPAATAVPDAQGRFAIEVSDLAPCADGEVRIEYCHVNGTFSAARAPFGVTGAGKVDLEQWQTARALQPLIEAVFLDNPAAARSRLRTLEDSSAPGLAKTVGRNLVATLGNDPKPTPAGAPPSISTMPLGDARPETAEVGWLRPAVNRIPFSDEIPSPLLDSGKIYATGLYAHSPSRYVFDLGGRWKTLRGQAGLHTFHQPHGSVVFVIKADGKEVYRSPVIRQSAKASYEIDLKDVKTLELIVEKAGSSNGGNWGLWLDPTLAR